MIKALVLSIGSLFNVIYSLEENTVAPSLLKSLRETSCSDDCDSLWGGAERTDDEYEAENSHSASYDSLFSDSKTLALWAGLEAVVEEGKRMEKFATKKDVPAEVEIDLEVSSPPADTLSTKRCTKRKHSVMEEWRSETDSDSDCHLYGKKGRNNFRCNKRLQSASFNVSLQSVKKDEVRKSTHEEELVEKKRYEPIIPTGESFFSDIERTRMRQLREVIDQTTVDAGAYDRLVQAMIYCYMSQTVSCEDEKGTRKCMLRNREDGSLRYLKQAFVLSAHPVEIKYFTGYSVVFGEMAEYCYALVNGVHWPLDEKLKTYCAETFKYS